MAMVTSAGGIMFREEYYPFGETSPGIYAHKRYRYCGKEKDEESNYYNYGARMYASWLCRFLSVDPLAGETPHFSPYVYANDNPINMIDPDGRQAVPDTSTTGKADTLSSANPNNDYMVDNNGVPIVVNLKEVEIVGTKSSVTSKSNITEAQPELSNGQRGPFSNETVLRDNQESLQQRIDSMIRDFNPYAQPSKAKTEQGLFSDGKVESKPGLVSYRRNVTSHSLQTKLKQFSVRLGSETINVFSGDRSPDRNKKAGGATGSRHTFGDAADIYVIGISNEDLAVKANESGLFNTIIYYPVINAKGAKRPHVHVDLKPGNSNVFLRYSPLIKNGKVTQDRFVPFIK